jgi:hypothetical protein
LQVKLSSDGFSIRRYLWIGVLFLCLGCSTILPEDGEPAIAGALRVILVNQTAIIGEEAIVRAHVVNTTKRDILLECNSGSGWDLVEIDYTFQPIDEARTTEGHRLMRLPAGLPQYVRLRGGGYARTGAEESVRDDAVYDLSFSCGRFDVPGTLTVTVSRTIRYYEWGTVETHRHALKGTFSIRVELPVGSKLPKVPAESDPNLPKAAVDTAVEVQKR